ncbi:monoamine oxidase [Maribacter vaceletii]|uniref:Monoamine oxidase n=1 Tax=Maribacter vaceletii TaxID=1206816 RepID=A0A495EFE5_9FLAO|nr:NAD(P)/FAD-dependent oxidoreductase [Maribacter vaceletii]RKR15253.1 monoamine oxidase [Maribacter vaceletii]
MKKQHTKGLKNIDRRDMLKKSSLLLAAAPFYFGLNSCISGSKKNLDADVIIIGAGLSGLNAALILEGAGLKVKIVEATDRLGGRVHTAKEKDVPGHPELGANGIGGGYARVIDAAEKHNVKIGSDRPRTEARKGELIYHIKNNFILPENWSEHSLNTLPEGFRKSLPAYTTWPMFSKINPLPPNDLAAWRNPKYKDWDKSVYLVLKEKGFSDDAIKLCMGTNSSYGVDAKNISIMMYFQILTWIGQQTASNGKGGAIVGGNQRLPKAMGAAFKQDILLNSPVKSISAEADATTITLNNGNKLRAPYTLVTLPTSALRHVSIPSCSTENQKRGFTNLEYTPVVQLHFVPTKKYWEEDGLPPSMWCDNLAGRFMALKNDIQNPDKVTSCVAFLNSNVAIEVDKMNRKDAITAVTKVLEDIRPSLKGALRFTYYWTWINNPYAGGAYAYWQPGQITDFANHLAKPIGRIHFAGEHTAIMNRGMEGAMESGERAALELLNLIG